MTTPSAAAAGRLGKAAGRAAKTIRRNTQAARVADRVAKRIGMSTAALNKVLPNSKILKHIETDFPAVYKAMDTGRTPDIDQSTKIYHSVFVNFGEDIVKALELNPSLKQKGNLKADSVDTVRRQMRDSTQAMSVTAQPIRPVAADEFQGGSFSLEDNGSSLADPEPAPEAPPRKGDSRFTEPGQSLMPGEEASDARAQSNKQFERIRTGKEMPPRQSGPDRFRGTRNGINPETLKTGPDLPEYDAATADLLRGVLKEPESPKTVGPSGYTERALGDTTVDSLRLASDGTVNNLQVYDGDAVLEGDLVKVGDSYVFRDGNGQLVEFSGDGQTGTEISDSLFDKKVYSSGSPVAVGDADISLFPQGGVFDTDAFNNIIPQIREFSDGAFPDEVVYQDLERLVNSYNEQKRLNPAQARQLLMDQFPDIKGEGARYQAALRSMNNAADLLTKIEEVRGTGQLNSRSLNDGRVGRMRPMPSDAELADANTNIERLNREIADAEIIQKNAEYVKNKVESGQETEGFGAEILIDFDLANRLAQIEGNSSNPLSELAFKFKTSGVSDGSLQIVREVAEDIEDFLAAARKERAVNNMVIAGPEDVSVADEMASSISTEPGTDVELNGRTIRVVDQPNPANFTSSLDDPISTMPPMIGQLRNSLREAFQERGVKVPPILGTKLEKRSGASRMPSQAEVSDYTMRIEEARKSGNPRLANKLSSELASKYNRPDNVPASEVAAQQGLAAEQGFGQSNEKFLSQQIGLDNPEVAVQFQRLTAEPAPDDLTPKEIAVRNLLKERYGDDAPLTQALESIYTGKTNPELSNLRERLASRDKDLAAREQSPALNPSLIVDPFGRTNVNTKRDRINTLRGRLGEQRKKIAGQLNEANKPLIGNIDDAVEQSAGRPAAVSPEGAAGAAGDARFNNLRTAVGDAYSSQDISTLSRLKSDLDKQISLSGNDVDADRRQAVMFIRDDINSKIKELSPEASIVPGKTPEDIRQLRQERTVKTQERDAAAAQQETEALGQRQRTVGATDKLMLQNQLFDSFPDLGINIESTMESPDGLELFATTIDEAEMISRLRENVPPDSLPESMMATLENRGLRIAEPGSKADTLNRMQLDAEKKSGIKTGYKIVRLDDGTTYINANLVLQDANGNPVKDTVRVAFPVMTKDNVPKDLRTPTSFVRVSPQGSKHSPVTYDPNAAAANRRGQRLGPAGSTAGTMFDPETIKSDTNKLNTDLQTVDPDESAPANQYSYEGEPFSFDEPVAGPVEPTSENTIRKFRNTQEPSDVANQRDFDERVQAAQDLDDFAAEVTSADADTPETSGQLQARQAQAKVKANENLADVQRKQAAQDLPRTTGSSPGNRIRNLSLALPTASLAVLAGTGMAPEGMTAYAEESSPEDTSTTQDLAALSAGGRARLSRAERIRRLRGGRSGGLAPAAFGTYQNISP